MNNRVLVTGAGGFVGKNLCPILEEAGFAVVPVYRATHAERKEDCRISALRKDIAGSTDWSGSLNDIDTVVHLAARAHKLRDQKTDNYSSYRELNVEGTRNLAKQSADAGVKRFIYLSSIKVNGEETDDHPFSFDQIPGPRDSYGRSKKEAEDALWKLAEINDMGIVVIRPPLIYGPGVKGNLMALTNQIRKGIPLPLGALNNRRDLVSIYNLCDLIKVCISHPAAPGNTFLVSDNEPMSTTQLVRNIARGLNQRAPLFSIPVWVLEFLAGITGNSDKVSKLTGDLQVDIAQTRRILDWAPPFTVAESFHKMFQEE